MTVNLGHLFSRSAVGRSVGLLAGFSVLALLSGHGVGAQQNAATLPGQSVTQLPDGRELIIGGTGSERAIVRDPRTGQISVAGRLHHGRAWHSATLLPDGSVLVAGGVDDAGLAVATAELIHPRSGRSEEIAIANWQPRVGHSATVLDGDHIVIAGGTVDGRPTGEIEVLDLTQWQVFRAGLTAEPRSNHVATLRADGRVQLSAGDAGSRAIIDIRNNRNLDVLTVGDDDDDSGGTLAASVPADGAVITQLLPRIMLRFARRASMVSVNDQTVVLISPAGQVPVAVIPVENGRLAFITPQSELLGGTTYAVIVDGALEPDGRTLPHAAISFTTAGATPAGASGVGDDEAWHPGSNGRMDDWRSKRARSRWQDLEPLQADVGVTALSGQALRLNGSPLKNVLLEINGRQAKTDASGRFLLTLDGTASGWHELWIDGRTANGKGATYGTFEATTLVKDGKTSVLPFTIWMPKIDTANAVRITSPTTKETVITTPAIPGLELHLPAGAVIKEHDGRIAREVSITPIPLDRTPFPLPAGVDVPIYFTVQPGGAYVAVPGSTGYQRGARLIYPNYSGRPAGTPMEFWHYDPEGGRGWYVYGRGTVNPSGSHVVPDPGVSIHEFTGAMVAPPDFAPLRRLLGDFFRDGDPVHLGTGSFVMDKTDLALPDTIPLALKRTYLSGDTRSRSFGIGSTHMYDIFLVGTVFPYTYIELVFPDGSRAHFPRISPGTSYLDAVYEHTSSPTPLFKSRITWNGDGWNLDLKDGSRWTFHEGFIAVRPQQSALTLIQDRFGNVVALTRNADFDLTHVTSTNGRFVSLTYDTSHRVTQATDNMSRTVQYTYDGSGRLWKVTDVAGGVTEYTYDGTHRMLTLKDARNIVYLTNEYDANGRISKQTQADSSTFLFAYTVDGSGNVTQVDVTNPRGFVRRVLYNSAGFVTSDTRAFGQSIARTTTYSRQSLTNLLLSRTDALSRQTSYAYDTFGNLTSVTRLAGTGNAVTESFTYEPTFQQMLSATDALSRVTTFEYDQRGALTKVRDPLNRDTLFAADVSGRITTIADPLSHVAQYGYDGPDLVSYTDPLGRATSAFVDAGGRVRSIRDPLQRATRYDYNAMDQVTAITDASGAQTNASYDANGNLLSVVDARSKTTSYTYDGMDRMATRTDPLSKSESFSYDGNGNLTQTTDRKSQLTTVAYDALDRPTSATSGSHSTTFGYDAGNRVTTINDSIAGAITRGYDLLDRPSSETTPVGTVGYTFDAVDRRLTMTVAGQTPVSYTHDDGDRLTAVTQGSTVTGFSYDTADRRSTLTLPNGIVVEYTSDAASQLTGLTFKLGGSTLGNLSYGYDLAGQRVSQGGTWARTQLPAALGSATYDAANRLTLWDEQAFTHDLNGNLTTDGARTLSWNTRDQLTGIAGSSVAGFIYDGVGRRQTASVDFTTRDFLYDGLNPVQEKTGLTVSANILSALGLDEFIQRNSAGAVWTYLTDAIGSVIGLTNGAGTVQAEYTYSAFGEFTVAGSTGANPVTFTGRENDDTGLYFYRARYYDPRLQRFVSEDPLEFSGGDANLYGYVGNSPTDRTDPSGLCWICPLSMAVRPGGSFTSGMRAMRAAAQRTIRETAPRHPEPAHRMPPPRAPSLEELTAPRPVPPPPPGWRGRFAEAFRRIREDFRRDHYRGSRDGEGGDWQNPSGGGDGIGPGMPPPFMPGVPGQGGSGPSPSFPGGSGGWPWGGGVTPGRKPPCTASDPTCA